MRVFKNILLTLLCIGTALSVSAQQNDASKIVGLWSTPYKTARQQGSLIVEFKRDYSVRITRSVTIENTEHAAFNQISGTWKLNGSVLSIVPESTEGKFKWTNLIAQQIYFYNEIPENYAEKLLASAKYNLPRLNDLHFASKMQIKQVTESKLILLNIKDSNTLTFTRIADYPKGGKLTPKPKAAEKASVATSTSSTKSASNKQVNKNDEPKPFGTDVFDNNYDDVTEVRIIKNEVVVEEKKLETEKIYTAVEESPKFPGGDTEMYNFLSKNIQYPEKAAQNNIQGRVTVQFVVEKDGSIGDVKVVRGKDPELNAEAIRIVKSFPKFIPGKMNGQTVRTWYTLPINFNLKS